MSPVTNEELILRTCLKEARALVLQATDTKATCILMVRLIMRVLERFGYASTPLSVGFQAWNAIMEAKMVENNRKPVNPEEAAQLRKEGAYVVEIDEESKTGQYPGHLILKTRSGWLIDPSIDQASRPEFDLPIDNWCERCPEDFPHPNPEMWRNHPNGSHLHYWIQDPLIKDFTTCPDWNVKLRDSPVNLVVNMCVQDGAVTKKKLRIAQKKNKKKRKRQ